MRTYEEIATELTAAVNCINAASIRALAMEMQSIDTAKAQADSSWALAIEAILVSNYSSAMEYNRRALDLYEELGDRVGIANVTSNMGMVFFETGEFAEALGCYRHAHSVSVELGDRNAVSINSQRMGDVYRTLGNFDEALVHYRSALLVNEEIGNRDGAAICTCAIGIVYADTGNYPIAIEQYRRALALHEELGDRAGVAVVNSNLGNVYAYTGELALALEHYTLALAVIEETESTFDAALVIGNIGTVHEDSGDYTKALDCYNRALDMYQHLGAHAETSRVNGNIISVLLKIGDHDTAEALLERQALMLMDNQLVLAQHTAHRAVLAEHRGDLDTAHRVLTQALTLASDTGARDQVATYHKALRDLAQKRNDFAAYIEHNNEHNRISEEIRGKEAVQKLAIMEAERKMEAERREHEKHRSLLYGALPRSVADRMIRGEDVSGDHFENAAVMFIDIVGFTMHTSHMPPSDVVKLLENIFRTLDALCDEHNVVKIKTVGDSYMCFRGDADAPTNALSVARVALAVAQHPFSWPTGESLNVRIGIHLGPATAGVIGTQRLQYDVWGDTVNVASRMESSSMPGNIHVSQAFAEALDPDFRRGDAVDGHPGEGRDPYRAMVADAMKLQERGEIEIKGKGSMTTFWLTS